MVDASRPGFPDAVAAALPAHGFWDHPVLVGVSGGGDSVALLVALSAIVPTKAVARLVVAHAEHDLRSEAPDDRRFTELLAADLQLPFVTRRLSVRAPDPADRGEGVEARARRARAAFLLEAAHAHGCRHVVVGHTADDQAETILHRLLRGTGPRGLAGMAAARELGPGVSLLRPMLTVPRAMVRGFLREVGHAWREDQTNADPARARNFLRHEILARCTAAHYPAAVEALVRVGQHAARVADSLAAAAEHLLQRHASRRSDGVVVMRAADLAGLDQDLLAEVFTVLWRREGWPRRDMTARHYRGLARLLEAAARSDRAAADFPGGVRVEAGPGRTLAVGRCQDGIATRR